MTDQEKLKIAEDLIRQVPQMELYYRSKVSEAPDLKSWGLGLIFALLALVFVSMCYKPVEEKPSTFYTPGTIIEP